MKKTSLLLLFLLTAVLLASCGTNGDVTGPSASALAATEVREYQGLDLSSITEFRENSILGPQNVDIDSYVLTVDGLVDKPIELTYNQVLKNTLYKKVVTLYCVEGWSVDILWEGVLLQDLLDQAGVRGEANTVIFYAADGYTTSLPLATILEKDMILAYKMNDVVLPVDRGFPFQLVAEDKLGYKWIKWVTRIELSDDEDYEGYWEQRGFTNEADIDY